MNEMTKKICLWLLIAALATTAPGLAPVAAHKHDELGGVWWCWDEFKEDGGKLSFSIVNLTTNSFKITGNPHDGQHIFPEGKVIEAYDSFTWKGHLPDESVPHGELVLAPVPGGGGMTGWGNHPVPRNFVCQVSFEKRKSAGKHGSWGTWVRLGNPPGAENENASATAKWVNGRWATAVSDHDMHNIMTMVSKTVTTTLYSQTNGDITLVIAQTPGNWTGWQVDWVQNDDIDHLPDPYDHD